MPNPDIIDEAAPAPAQPAEPAATEPSPPTALETLADCARRLRAFLEEGDVQSALAVCAQLERLHDSLSGG